MPLTRLQARDRYIEDSIAQFLGRNLVVAYNAEVATGAYPQALTVVKGKPDDPSVSANPPTIAIATLTSTNKDDFVEVGSNVKWRFKNIVFYCYPAILTTGEPSQEANLLLQSYMKDALGTYAIKILDYSNNSFSPTNILYCSDVMYIDRVIDPMERNDKNANAITRHRFDMHLTVKYAVVESTAT